MSTRAKDRICGRIMRMPRFDGQVPDTGPIHMVSDVGDEYLLIAGSSSTPGRVEDLAAASAGRYEPHIDQDRCVTGDIFGSVIWRAEIIPPR